MSEIYTTTLRLNLDNEDDRRAYEYLRQMDRTRYKSYSAAVIAAINDHFEREARLADDPFLETRERQETFLREIKDTVQAALQTTPLSLGALASLLQPVQKAAPELSEESLDTAMDFIDQL